MIIVSKYLVPKGYAAMAVYPFVFFKRAEYINPERLNHEKIHLRQQLELLIIPFYIWYGIEYLANLVKFKDKKKAYKNISFEVEAYTNESNFDYLKNRKIYAFLKS